MMNKGIIATNRGRNSFTPLALSPHLWIDGSKKSQITSSVDSLGTVVDSITSRDTNAFVSAPLVSGALQNKPRYNGEGLYCNGSYGFTVGTVSDFNYLHNSTGFTVYLVFKQLPLVDSTVAYPVFRTKASATQVGLEIGYYNRAGTSNQKTFQISISNGTSNQFLINGLANSVVDDSYNILKIKFTGTSLQAWVKPLGGSFTSIGIDSTGSVSASNAAQALLFCTNGTSWKGYMKHFIAFNRGLSAGDETLMDSWATSEMNKSIVEQPLNIYLSGPAQSNFWGRGDNATIASDLNGKTGAYTWYPPSNTVATRGIPYWTELEKGVSSNPDAGETYHGFMNRFTFEMINNTSSPLGLIGYAVSATPLKATTSVVDWNVSSVEGGDLYNRWATNVLPFSLESLQHVLRKTPVLRGMVIMQGEQDAINDGSSYQNDLQLWIKTAIDHLISLGLDTTKLRVFIFRIANHYSGFNVTHLNSVRTAQVNVATQSGGVDFSAYIPSKFKALTWSNTDAKSMNGDNLHYSSAGLDSMGIDLFDYFKLYYNE